MTFEPCMLSPLLMIQLPNDLICKLYFHTSCTFQLIKYFVPPFCIDTVLNSPKCCNKWFAGKKKFRVARHRFCYWQDVPLDLYRRFTNFCHVWQIDNIFVICLNISNTSHISNGFLCTWRSLKIWSLRYWNINRLSFVTFFDIVNISWYLLRFGNGVNPYWLYSRFWLLLLQIIIKVKPLHELPKIPNKIFLPRLAVVFAQAIEVKYSVENEDAIGAAPSGDAQQHLSHKKFYRLLRCDLY